MRHCTQNHTWQSPHIVGFDTGSAIGDSESHRRGLERRFAEHFKPVSTRTPAKPLPGSCEKRRRTSKIAQCFPIASKSRISRHEVRKVLWPSIGQGRLGRAGLKKQTFIY